MNGYGYTPTGFKDEKMNDKVNRLSNRKKNRDLKKFVREITGEMKVDRKKRKKLKCELQLAQTRLKMALEDMFGQKPKEEVIFMDYYDNSFIEVTVKKHPGVTYTNEKVEMIEEV